LTGSGVGVGVGVDAELKKKPGSVDMGITEEGALRLMGVRLGVVTVVDGMAGAGAWALMLAREGNGGLTTGEDVTKDDAGGKAGTGSVGTAGGTEHGGVTVTVTGESMKTVSMPFVPVVVKADRSSCAAGFGVIAGNGTGVTLNDVAVVEGVENKGGDDDAGVLVGTIPPKLNVEGMD
jgi:hypothetical protein